MRGSHRESRSYASWKAASAVEGRGRVCVGVGGVTVTITGVVPVRATQSTSTLSA